LPKKDFPSLPTYYYFLFSTTSVHLTKSISPRFSKAILQNKRRHASWGGSNTNESQLKGFKA